MKKEIALIVTMSSIGVMNAMDFELAQKKQNSTAPFQQQLFCCRLGSAVPVCDKCFVRIVADNMLTVEKKPSAQPNNKLSASQERRLP